MPILRDVGELETRFGVLLLLLLLLAAAAVCEFGPIVMMSLLLAHDYTHSTQAALLLSFVRVAFAAAFLVLRVRPPRVVQLLGRTLHASSQLPVRLCMLSC